MEIVKNKIYYHVQRERRWELGQKHFIGLCENEYCAFFNDNAHNYEDKNTHKVFSLPAVMETMVHYLETGEKDSQFVPYFSFDPLDTIKLMRKVIMNYSRYIREFIFEEVRKEHFPIYPSRKNGMWVISKREHVAYWIKTLGVDEKSVVYEVELTGKIHEANHMNIKLTTNSFNGIRQQAYQYWLTDPSDIVESKIGDECIFEGLLMVKNIHNINKFY